jgi:hypothetical protein
MAVFAAALNTAYLGLSFSAMDYPPRCVAVYAPSNTIRRMENGRRYINFAED